MGVPEYDFRYFWYKNVTTFFSHVIGVYWLLHILADISGSPGWHKKQKNNLFKTPFEIRPTKYMGVSESEYLYFYTYLLEW